MRLSGVAEHGYTMLYGKCQIIAAFFMPVMSEVVERMKAKWRLKKIRRRKRRILG
jgi:hypothetical protein